MALFGDADRTAATASDTNTRHDIDLALGATTAKQIDRTLVPQGIAIVLIVAVFDRRLEGTAIWWWGACALANVVRGAVFNVRYKRSISDGVIDDQPSVVKTVSSLVFGATWGSLVVIADRFGSPDDRSLAVIITLAAMSLSAVVTAGSRSWFLTVLAGNVVTIGIAWTIADDLDWAFGGLIVIYFALAAFLHDTMHRMIRKNTESMQRNEVLAARLAEVLAHEDPMTKILNRDGLMAWVDRSTPPPSTQLVAVAVGNVERLSAVNELFGADHGDAVLTAIGARLAGSATAKATPCRVAGDEFAIVELIDSEAQSALTMARLVEAVREPVHLGGQTLEVSMSTAVMCGRSNEVEALLMEASAAVRSERARRSPSLASASGPLQDRRELIDELQIGLDNGAVIPWFQPIVGCDQHAVIAWEALARWIHPTRGLIPPMQFLGLVDLGGFASAFTDRMIDDSVRFVAELNRRGLSDAASVHVNLAAAQARRPNLVEFVTEILERHGVSPSALTIEMTEQDIPDIDEQLVGNLQRLEDLGVGLSIDDFGTGYSSLSHLLDIRATELKIDKRFVEGLPSDQTSAELVRGVLGLARGMGLSTVAEGVETTGQADFLLANGCDSYQGFLTSPALPAAEALAFVALAPQPHRPATTPSSTSKV